MISTYYAKLLLWLIRQRSYRVWIEDRGIWALDVPDWLMEALQAFYWDCYPLMEGGFLGEWG